LVQAESVTHTLVYTYNGDGVRVASAVDGDQVQFAMDQVGLPQVLVEITGTHVITYLYGLARLAQLEGGETEWFLGDALGSVRQLVDGDGEVILAREYSPFGELLSESGTGSSGYAFTGEQWDKDVGLLFLRARRYDPAVGRFVSKDPWSGITQKPGTLNRYTYVLNNSPNGLDPSGMICIFGFGNCDEEPDLAAIMANLPFYIVQEDFCLPGDWGCWGGIEYGKENTEWLARIYKYQATYVPMPLDDYEISLVETYADRYGIPPELLAATLETEIYDDTSWHDPVVDTVLWTLCGLAESPLIGSLSTLLVTAGEYGPIGWRLKNNRPVFVGWGPGMAQFHTATAREVERYVQATGLPALEPGRPHYVERVRILAETEGSIRYTAAYLRMLADLRTDTPGPHYNDLDDVDMQIIYGGFRAGVGKGKSYDSVESFQQAAAPGDWGIRLAPHLLRWQEYYGSP
jgi:RHS repeat-associated protein